MSSSPSCIVCTEANYLHCSMNCQSSCHISAGCVLAVNHHVMFQLAVFELSIILSYLGRLCQSSVDHPGMSRLAVCELSIILSCLGWLCVSCQSFCHVSAGCVSAVNHPWWLCSGNEEKLISAAKKQVTSSLLSSVNHPVMSQLSVCAVNHLVISQLAMCELSLSCVCQLSIGLIFSLLVAASRWEPQLWWADPGGSEVDRLGDCSPCEGCVVCPSWTGCSGQGKPCTDTNI